MHGDVHRRMRQYALGYGAIRDVGVPVQFSVFEAELKPLELNTLLAQLTELIDADQDQVSFYSLSNGDKKISIGALSAMTLV